MRKLILLYFLVIAAFSGHGQSLDSSFSWFGYVFTYNSGLHQDYTALESYHSGKLLTGAAFFAYPVDGIFLRMINSNGTANTSFGTNGAVCHFKNLLNINRLTDIKASGEGALIAATSGAGYVICRIRDDGSLDSTFGNNGWIVQNGLSNIQSQSNLIVLPDSSFYISTITQTTGVLRIDKRLKNGQADISFGSNGQLIFNNILFNIEFCPIDIQSDGKVIIGTNDNNTASFILIRINTNGSVDSTFGQNGWVTVMPHPTGGRLHNIDIQPDDKILVTGLTATCGGRVFVGRFLADGNMDTTFSNSWLNVSPFNGWGADVDYLSDNKILVTCGSAINISTPVNFLMFDQFGIPDSTFNGNGTYGLWSDYVRETKVLNECSFVTSWDGGYNGQYIRLSRVKICSQGIITSLEENQIIDETIVYPNPTSGLVHLSCKAEEIEVISSFGETIKHIRETNIVDLGELTPSVYFLRYSYKGKFSSVKVIKY